MVHLPRFVFALLLVFPLLSPHQTLAADAKPTFPEGSFKSANPDGMPVGWNIPDYLKASFSLRQEEGRNFLHLDWPHIGYVTPDCRIEVAPAWQTVKVAMWVRVPDLKSKPGEGGAFEFRYDFLDKSGKTMDVQKEWPKFERASAQWSQLRSTCDVPSGAAYVKFWPGFINAAGSFDLSDLTVEITTRDNSPVEKLRVVAPPSPSAPAATTALPVAPAPAGSVFGNGGFEGNYVAVPKPSSPKAQIEGEIAPGWSDDSGWGEVSIAYSREEANVQEGKAAQRMEVRSIGQGAAQLNQMVALRKGRVYHVSAQLRSSTNAGGELLLRQAGAPYEQYGRASVRITPEWRPFQLYVRAPADIEARVLFVPNEPGTYWIDDVKFQDVTDALNSSQVTKEGNLLANSSFEAGLSDGWHMRVGGFEKEGLWAAREHRDLRSPLDATTAAQGKQSVAVTLDEWMIGAFTSPLTAVTFGQTYTASIAMKSDRRMTVGFSLDDTNASQDVQIGPEWKRYTITGTVQTGTQTRLRVRCIARNEGAPVTFWLDAASLEQGAHAAVAYRPAFPAEVSLSVPRPGSIVFDSEPAPMDVRAVAADGGALPQGATLRWSVEDLFGRSVDLPSLALPANSAVSIPPVAAAPRGLFKVRAQVLDAAGKPLSSRIERLFARLPRPRELTSQQAEHSYFGAHIDLQPEKLKIARVVGVRWIRMHDATMASLWARVEPKPGEWSFNDGGVQAAREAGLHLLGMLGGAPNWASANPLHPGGYFANWNKPDAPGAAAAWEEYVRRTVTHYKPWITTWEIWNEPYVNGAKDGFFPNGSPQEYAELMRRASIAARQANPQVTLVGVCSPGNDYKWLDSVLSTAGPAYYDAMSFHGYGNRLQGGTKTQFAIIVENLNAVQTRYGGAKPVWNSEGGPNDNVSWYGQEASAVRFQMTQFVRLDIAQLAVGVRKFFPYTMHSDPEHRAGTHMMMEHDGSIKAGVAARAVLASLVDGATYAGRTTPVEGLEAHAFRQTDGKTVQACWSNDSQPHQLNIPAGYRAWDVLGNTVGGKSLQVSEEPIYLVEQ